MASYQREVAWRVFAREYNDSDLEIQAEGERAPSYVVSPLGAKVNRLLLVGVLTRTEPVSPDSEMWRAQISDPTGVFHVYAGQYQPDAAAKLQELDPPCFVAVVGKSRTYRPEDGRVLVSVTPEVVKEVDRDARDRWVLETARQTQTRLEAADLADGEPDIEALRGEDVPSNLAEGLEEAVPHYGTDRMDEYKRMLRGSLEYLVSGSSGLAGPSQGGEFASGDDADESEAVETTEVVEETVGDDPEPSEGGDADGDPSGGDSEDGSEDDEDGEDYEEVAFDLIKELDEGKGAPWEEILDAMEDKGATETQVEEALNSLMDKGRIYEPILGRLKPS